MQASFHRRGAVSVCPKKEEGLKATVRRYERDADFERVGEFLVETYRTSGGHINWVQPRWEYMHFHPYIENVDLRSIGVWELDGEIVGVAHPELNMGTAYFEVHPERGTLKGEMLQYAEEHISTSQDGRRHLRVYINDQDPEFQRIALAK
jgi:hypothetical protein